MVPRVYNFTEGEFQHRLHLEFLMESVDACSILAMFLSYLQRALYVLKVHNQLQLFQMLMGYPTGVCIES